MMRLSNDYIVFKPWKDSIPLMPEVISVQYIHMKEFQGICRLFAPLFLLFTMQTFTSSRAMMRSKLFTANRKLDNKVSSVVPITEGAARSSTECSIRCGEDCSCFGFNPNEKMCRIHTTCDPAIFTLEEPGWAYFMDADSTRPQPKDCKDVYNSGETTTGVYTIYPWSESNPNYAPVSVYCDMAKAGGGWTAIQRRLNGNVDFNRLWADYKAGFGTMQDAYWIGNDAIHQLTKGRNSSLYISIVLNDNTAYYELYGQFGVSDEVDKYRLFLGGPATGNLGDSMFDTAHTGYSNRDLSGMQFTTQDQDNDGKSTANCADYFPGGWWFNKCYVAFLNGQWTPGYWLWPWYPTLTSAANFKETMMLIKAH